MKFAAAVAILAALAAAHVDAAAHPSTARRSSAALSVSASADGTWHAVAVGTTEFGLVESTYPVGVCTGMASEEEALDCALTECGNADTCTMLNVFDSSLGDALGCMAYVGTDETNIWHEEGKTERLAQAAALTTCRETEDAFSDYCTVVASFCY